MLPKEMFEVIIRAWQVGDIIAVKETRPVAACHLEKVVNRRCEMTTAILPAYHGAEQANDASLNLFGTGLVFIRK